MVSGQTEIAGYKPNCICLVTKKKAVYMSTYIHLYAFSDSVHQ